MAAPLADGTVPGVTVRVSNQDCVGRTRRLLKSTLVCTLGRNPYIFLSADHFVGCPGDSVSTLQLGWSGLCFGCCPVWCNHSAKFCTLLRIEIFHRGERRTIGRTGGTGGRDLDWFEGCGGPGLGRPAHLALRNHKICKLTTPQFYINVCN